MIEVSHTAPSQLEADYKLNITEQLTKLQGYVLRTQSGFQFVDAVVAARIPEPHPTVDAPIEVSEADTA
jgi:hypothetical protein